VVARRLLSFGVVSGALVALAPACKPDLDQIVSVVTEPTVLAVRSDPAETAPMTSMTFTALYVGPTGPIANPDERWQFCEARKPLAELGPVNTKCEQPSGDWFVPLGSGATAQGTIPSDACRLFGPDVPPPEMGQPQGRPVDPDSTGGFYDPVQLYAPGASATVVIQEARLSCGAGVLPSDVAVQYRQRYHANTNPAPDSLAIVGGATLVTADKGTNEIARNQRVTLEVAWARCPTVDACGDGVCGPDETVTQCDADCTMTLGCTGAERYVVFDQPSQSLLDVRESLAAAWFTTGGSFDADRTGRNANDLTTTSDNGWTAPSTAGTVHLWVVLRDDRGGAGWAEYVFDVQ
jgi:hypothetical protein